MVLLIPKNERFNFKVLFFPYIKALAILSLLKHLLNVWNMEKFLLIVRLS